MVQDREAFCCAVTFQSGKLSRFQNQVRREVVEGALSSGAYLLTNMGSPGKMTAPKLIPPVDRWSNVGRKAAQEG